MARWTRRTQPGRRPLHANDEAQTFTEAALIGADLELHPVQ
jgi:hypothetical protein